MPSIVRETIALVTQRRTAHHVHQGDKTVAIRIDADGRFELTYSDGVTHRGLAELVAEELAETFLGIAPAKPPARASVPLGEGWSIALRRDEVWPEDPGNGTPAMVCGPFGKSATYWFALDTGMVHDSQWGEFDIPGHIYRKLDKAGGDVETYLHDCNRWFAAHPRN